MRSLILGTLSCFFMAGVTASDWPQFRGPTGQGVSSSKLPVEWGDAKNLKWKTPLPGPGSSSPIVWNDRIFVTCYTGYAMKKQGDIGKIDELKRHLLCINRSDGKIMWDSTVEGIGAGEDKYQGFIQDHGYSSSTPVTDGETVFVYFGKAGVFAFDFSGKQLWNTKVGTMSSMMRWGSAASLLLHKDHVIVNSAEESRCVQALDKKSGSVVWKAENSKLQLCYSTPLLIKKGDQEELVVSMSGCVWSLNPDTGKPNWTATTEITGNVSPSMLEQDGVLYVNGGFPNILATAINLKSDKHEVLWKSKNASYVPSPVLHEGRLYFASHTGIARCVDPKTGDSIYEQRLPIKGEAKGGAAVYASPLLADGKVYIVTRTGGAFVLSAEPKYKLLATNKFSDDDTDFNASPAVMGNQLLLRSNKFLYCIGE